MLDWIISLIGIPLGYVMWFCYILVNNYGLAIILFTLLSKIIMFPISLSVQKNSVKMVKLKPELDEIARRYQGDKDRIAEEQIKLYDREKYSPALGCLPLFFQIPIILGLINVIYNPLKHLLHFKQDVIDAFVEKTSEILAQTELGGAAQLKVIETLSNPLYTDKFKELQSSFAHINIEEMMRQIQSLDTRFLGIDLAATPSIGTINELTIIPLVSGLSALILCLVQNRVNVLQREQGKWNQWGTSAFMIIFSLYFTFILPAGVGLYWTFGNLFAIVQLFILNKVYDPRKYIDYEARAAQAKQVPVLTKEEKQALKAKQLEYKRREKEDYRRFYSDDNQKQLVFYSEKNGFYKYFENTIEEILNQSNIVIHYVTSDPEDQIFSKKHPQIKPYYIGDKKLISFMMKMDADMVVMTMSDLDNFHIKRSLVRKDVEYVYMFHYPLSTHMVLREGALDNYDTIFCVGAFQFDEIRQWEKFKNLKEKKLIECGYGVIENMYEKYMETHRANDTLENQPKKILIAPSWQEDNILDTCIDTLLENLIGKGYEVKVRPHPEYVKRYKDRMDAIVSRYPNAKEQNLIFELDFTSSSSIFNSDVVITDWSGTAYEFAFVTKKPALFINTPPKINNSNYDKIEAKPLEMVLRDKLGKQLDIDDLSKAYEVIEEMLQKQNEYSSEISKILDETISNFGSSGKVGAEYIISTLQKKKKEE